MTKLYNRTSGKAKLQQLRRNMTKAAFRLWHKLKGRPLEGVKFFSQYGGDNAGKEISNKSLGIGKIIPQNKYFDNMLLMSLVESG